MCKTRQRLGKIIKQKLLFYPSTASTKGHFRERKRESINKLRRKKRCQGAAREQTSNTARTKREREKERRHEEEVRRRERKLLPLPRDKWSEHEKSCHGPWHGEGIKKPASSQVRKEGKKERRKTKGRKYIEKKKEGKGRK